MNQTDRLERDLTAWFEDTAVPRTPDYVDDILERTAHARQRPRWSFVDRFLPRRLAPLNLFAPKRLPWRTIGLLAVLGLLLAAVAAYVGSRPRLPAPFGLAANGLVAYESGGDIFTVDPRTGARRVIAGGPETDMDPRWSLDGTRLALLREVVGGTVLVITDPDGGHEVIGDMVLPEADSDTIAWSPDGRSVSVGAKIGSSREIGIVDAASGHLTVLTTPYRDLEVFWRPGGRQLMFLGNAADGLGLFLASVDTNEVTPLPLSRGDNGTLRPVGWTPDGRRFAFHRAALDTGEASTYLVEVDTGVEEGFPVGFGHLSNDGTRIAGFNGVGREVRICVIRIDGGPCVWVGEDAATPEQSDRGALQWTPDDQWLIAVQASGPPGLIDPAGEPLSQPTWLAEGGESIQRIAP